MDVSDPNVAISEAGEIAPAARPSSPVWIWTLTGSIFFAAAGHMLIKWGVVYMTAHSVGRRVDLVSSASLPLVLGLSIYLMGTVLWMFTVSRKEISYLYPLTSLTYVLVVAGGALVFHEPISALHWVGLMVIVAGVALMQVASRAD